MFPGEAFKDFDQAIRHVEWKLTKAPADIYVCMSGQSQTEPVPAKGKRWAWNRAKRGLDLSVRFPGLWMDVDVKEDAYPTTEAALTAFGQWRRKVDLPLPSYVVMTGSGGFHAHWTLFDAIDKATWEPLAQALVASTKAHGLVIDGGCTVDAARLLRIPDTFNCKHAPPKLVMLGHKGDRWELSRIQQALGPYVGHAKAPVQYHGQGRLFPGLTPRPPIQLDPKEMAGLEYEPGPLPTIEQVAAECPFVRDTFRSHGRGLLEPLWRESLKVAYYCQDGPEVAHELSMGHDGYSEEETDAKYARIAKDHGTGKYGWPQCATISTAGAIQCAGCRHFGGGKSPLNFAVAALLSPAPANTAAGNPAVAADMGPLPKGYSHDDAGYIWRSVPDPLDEAQMTRQRVCGTPMWGLWPQERHSTTGTYAINFVARISASNTAEISLPYRETTDAKRLASYLSEYGMMLNETVPNREFRKLMASFVEELHAGLIKATRSENFGWSMDEEAGKEVAFVYGNTRWNCVGNTPVVLPDRELSAMYTPCGQLDTWKKAARLITSQKRPALDTILAGSFGAPLVALTGHNGFVMNAYSPDSGIGKSSVMVVGQSVWADPVAGMAGNVDTGNFVDSRLGHIRHLPFMYDEMNTEEQAKALVAMVFGMAQGKTKGRLDRSARSKKVNTYSTLLISASNNSLSDYIATHTKLTTAGLYRVFGFRVPRNITGDGMINGGAAQGLLGDLKGNYGQAGKVYAQYLGQNAEAVKKLVTQAYSRIHTLLDAKPDERFWVATIAVVLMGARFANQLELTEIDEVALAKFLCAEFVRMRDERERSPVDITKSANLLDYVTDYVNTRRQQTLTTDKVWRMASRPPAGYKVTEMMNDRLMGRLCVHAIKDDLLLRISCDDFGDWLENKRKVPKNVLIKQVLDMVGKRIRTHLGLHTRFQASREWVIEFDLAKLPELYSFN